ncbi:Nif3-like dinuclear metal center hexameric protein [Solidesulfovibrio sp.]|uniref:Nif3-like dinuclear metal center hexameric protein n=1 Tax=Solidesulfovibrio sp. TaxID=2910990 RepID=UPI002B1EAE1D|nr:Nif3-like dinuclear metal center hexameric protein [Solidesulfovibrio sp.]MEA5088239.1 Nif3-like dinuclear metal center hexameric protein [Solidesulfovibrio sp.]
MRVTDLLAAVEATADPGRAASWDRSGVQIAGTRETCDKLAVALDPTPGFVAEALTWGAQVLLVHHPLALSPRLPDRVDDYHRVLAMVLSSRAWLYAAHTSLDTAVDGPPAWLAEALGLTDRRVLEPAGKTPFFAAHWNVAAPEAARNALETLPGVTLAPPAPGRLEAVFPQRLSARACDAVTAASPDAVLFSLTELATPAETYGYGCVGALPEPVPFAALLGRLATLLPRSFFPMAGEEPETVATLAYCPGSGADMAGRAFAAGADVYLTGDLKYHQALAVPPGKCVLDVGHFSLEEVMLRRFAEDLAATLGSKGPAVRFFPGNDPFSAYVPQGASPRGTE